MSLDFEPQLPRNVERFREHWKAIVAFGILSAILGILALLLSFSATLAAVLMIGVFMSAAGLLQIAIGFRTRTWGRFFAFELAGLVYLVAGLFAVFSPLEASVVLTLLLGAGLIATAVSRLVVAAIATGLLGLFVVLGWPGNSLFVLGILLGVDLIFQGTAWTVLGLKLKPAA